MERGEIAFIDSVLAVSDSSVGFKGAHIAMETPKVCSPERVRQIHLLLFFYHERWNGYKKNFK